MTPALLELAGAILTLLLEELGKEEPAVRRAAVRVAEYVQALFDAQQGGPSGPPARARDVLADVEALRQELLSESALPSYRTQATKPPMRPVMSTKHHDESDQLKENENKQGIAPNTQKTGYPESRGFAEPQNAGDAPPNEELKEKLFPPDGDTVSRDPRADRAEQDRVAIRNQRVAEVEVGRNPDGTKPAGEPMVGGQESSADKYGHMTSKPRPDDSRFGKKLLLGGVRADGSKGEELYLGSTGTRPVTGVWKKGDLAFNAEPSPGGFVGWVCVAETVYDGEPGSNGYREITPAVWRGFGLIEA